MRLSALGLKIQIFKTKPVEKPRFLVACTQLCELLCRWVCPLVAVHEARNFWQLALFLYADILNRDEEQVFSRVHLTL